MRADNTSTSDNWHRIVALLHDLPPNGPDGFEGLVAVLLEGLTGKSFFVAATGRQPQGDAVSHDVRISVQAKRYGLNTALDANKIIADFQSARAAANHRLDVYVVAVTRETSQLRAELEPCQRDTGVDIVVLADDDGSPELSALCVAFWPQVKCFFAVVQPDLAVWIEAKKDDAIVRAVVQCTKAKVSDGLNTFVDLRELGRKRMARVFRPLHPDRAQAGVQIRLKDAVERAAPREELLKWWAQENEPNAYIEAQEGCGKSWVAAAFAEHLVTGDAAPVVLWLESLDWTGAKTLDEVVAAGLRTVLPAGDLRVEVFASKIFRVWPRPVLLVLDGVNEHGCLESAQRLLRHYAHHCDHYPNHLRLLFTARPLNVYPGYRAQTWHGSRRIILGGFTNPEFDEALRRFAPDVVAESIPLNVRTFAAVPRFFRLALRLRDRLRDLGQLTKPVLLFADLMDKMEHDPDMRRLFAGTPEARLAHLAKHSQQVEGGKALVSNQHLAECFPDFAKALDDLAEQRIVLDRQIGKVVVSTEHVVLGFALHLLQITEANPGDTEAALRDRLALALEPNREDDTRTEGLYVALLLSLLRDLPDGQSWDKGRRALLFLWCGGHNAHRTETRLSFWAHIDLPAYRGVVESLFMRYLSGGQDTDLIVPIAHRWVKEGASSKALIQLLSEWLTLVYPGTDSADSAQKATERLGFPRAETHEQLRLTYAAISILSLRPDDAVLPALVRCARSCEFCSVPEEMNGKIHDTRLKTPYENLSILLQWNYTEAVLPRLIAMAKAAPHDLATQHGLWVLAESLDLAEIPPDLRRPNPHRSHEPRDDSPATIIAEFRKWIHDTPAAKIHWPRILRLELLVEESVATLDARDVDGLRAELSRELAAIGSHAGRDKVDELFPPLFPWIARFAPTTAQQLSRELWSYAIRSANPTGVALDAPLVPLLPAHLTQLMSELNAALDRLRNDKNIGAFLTRMSKVFLLSEDEAAILRWFEIVLGFPLNHEGEEWRVLPVPTMLEKIATPTLADACWQRFELAQAQHPDNPKNRQVRYWLTLYACLIRGSSAAGRRASALARTLPTGHCWADALMEIVAVSGDAAVIDEALRDSEFRRHFAEKGAAHHFAWFLRLPLGTCLSPEVQDLLPQLPLTVAAELVRWTNGENEHLSFARMLAEAALRRARGASAIVEQGFELGWTRALGDHRAWWEIDETEPESRTNHSPLSPVWGVNRGRMEQLIKAFGEARESAIQEQNRRMNDAIIRMREKMEAIADEYLVRFHGRLVIERWAALRPDEFRDFAQSFFETLTKNETHRFELSLFCDAVLNAICTLDVALADRLNEEFYGGSRGTVMIDGIIPSFLFCVMAHELNPQEPAITALRIKLLGQCRNDRDLLATVVAARHGHTITWLRQYAHDHLGESPLAKERALAVSLLAFAESSEDRSWLATRAASDPSQWVRDHAEWALKVHDQSAVARRLWDEVLLEIQRPGSDVLLVSTVLVRLQALLPPTALLWPRAEGPNKRVNALVSAFWYTWQNRGGAKGEREIFRRKLDQYFRGEHITDVAKRMAPWWRPN